MREGGGGGPKYVSPLRKHAYSNIVRILPPKKRKLSDEKFGYFHIPAQYIDCGYSLERLERF